MINELEEASNLESQQIVQGKENPNFSFVDKNFEEKSEFSNIEEILDLNSGLFSQKEVS